MTPPGKQNQSSSLPQQEKLWTLDGLTIRQLKDGKPIARIALQITGEQIVDAHNTTLSESKPEEKVEGAGSSKWWQSDPHLLGIPPAPADNAQAVQPIILSEHGVSSPVGGVSVSPNLRMSREKLALTVFLPPSVEHVLQMKRELERMRQRIEFLRNIGLSTDLHIAGELEVWCNKISAVLSTQDSNSPATSVSSPETPKDQ